MSGDVCAARLIKPPSLVKTCSYQDCTRRLTGRGVAGKKIPPSCRWVRALISAYPTAYSPSPGVDYDSPTARWKGKPYYRSFVLVLCSPEPSAVGLDDRSTDGKPESHAF